MLIIIAIFYGIQVASFSPNTLSRKPSEFIKSTKLFNVNSIMEKTVCGISVDAAYGEGGEDLVWSNMRKDARFEAAREPLLASFMHATILSHNSLERSVAFHLANLLSSPAMISTQIQALILEVSTTCPVLKI